MRRARAARARAGARVARVGVSGMKSRGPGSGSHRYADKIVEVVEEPPPPDAGDAGAAPTYTAVVRDGRAYRPWWARSAALTTAFRHWHSFSVVALLGLWFACGWPRADTPAAAAYVARALLVVVFLAINAGLH